MASGGGAGGPVELRYRRSSGDLRRSGERSGRRCDGAIDGAIPSTGPRRNSLTRPSRPLYCGRGTRMAISPVGLGDRRRLLRPLHASIGLVLHPARRPEPRRVLPLGAPGALVARRHRHGRDHLRRRHAAGGHRALVAANGVAGNWLWWNFVMSGMLTVFFFARLWRRARVMTDVELAEVRYSGEPAALPARLPRALPRDPDQPHHPRLGHARDDQDPHDLAGLRDVSVCGIVVSGRGPRGGHLLPHHRCRTRWPPACGRCSWTDLVQFVIKMTAVIVLAVYAVRAVGGIAALKARRGRALRERGGGAVWCSRCV